MRMPKYTLTKENIHIEDSYKIENKSEMRTILTIIRARAEKQGFHYNRSLASWVNEWTSHNLLYTRGVAKERTGSVDLNEDVSRFMRFCYWFLSNLSLN